MGHPIHLWLVYHLSIHDASTCFVLYAQEKTGPREPRYLYGNRDINLFERAKLQVDSNQFGRLQFGQVDIERFSRVV